MSEVIELLNRAKEVLAWCIEVADEKWIQDHLGLVDKNIARAIAILEKQVDIIADLEAENKRLKKENDFFQQEIKAGHIHQTCSKCNGTGKSGMMYQCNVCGGKGVRQVQALESDNEPPTP